MTLPDEIVVNGATYKRIDRIANRVSAYVMYDCHLFRQLRGNSVDALIEEWRKECADPDPKYGAPYLCPVIVLDGERELRRVGRMVFREGPSTWPETDDAVRDWRRAVESDPEISRILAMATTEPQEDGNE